MIVRILGEGQFELDESHLDELNELDDQVAAAVTAEDEEAFEGELSRLLDRVRALGRPVPAEHLGASDLILPGPGSTIPEVAALLGEEGLIPG